MTDPSHTEQAAQPGLTDRLSVLEWAVDKARENLQRVNKMRGDEYCGPGAVIEAENWLELCRRVVAASPPETPVPQSEPEPTCEVCGSAEDVLQAPVMTGVPFNAPRAEQRYVCGACFRVWHSEGKTTSEEILAYQASQRGQGHKPQGAKP